MRNLLSSSCSRGVSTDHAVGALPCAVAVVVVLGLFLPSFAFADMYLINPATKRQWSPGELRVEFGVNTKKMSNVSKNMRVQGDVVKINTMVNFNVAKGERVAKAGVEISSSPAWREDRSAFMGQLAGSQLRYELFTDIPFATTQQLLGVCQVGKSTLSRTFILKVIGDGGYAAKRRKSIMMNVVCIDRLPSTVVERVKLSCPPGYWVERTTKREFTYEFDPTRPPPTLNATVCVPQGTMAGGKACPFIYTRETPGGEWLDQGTILTYHNGKATERTQSQELTAFSGSVLIREIDPETSYIDSLSVILFYPDGSKAVLAPDVEELQAIDGEYFITDQGDEVEVVFEEPAGWDFDRAEITAHGYYKPY